MRMRQCVASHELVMRMVVSVARGGQTNLADGADLSRGLVALMPEGGVGGEEEE